MYASYLLIHIAQFLKSNLRCIIIDYNMHIYVYTATKYVRVQLNIFDNCFVNRPRHLIPLSIYMGMHSYCILHPIHLFLFSYSLSSLTLILPEPHAYVFYKLIWLYEWIIHMCIIDYMSVFACLHMLGIAHASVTNRVVLFARFDVLCFLLKYGS